MRPEKVARHRKSDREHRGQHQRNSRRAEAPRACRLITRRHEPEARRAEAYFVAALERRRAGDAPAVNHGAVGRVEVGEHEAAEFARDRRVIARDRRLIQNDVVAGMTADLEERLVQWIFDVRAAANRHQAAADLAGRSGLVLNALRLRRHCLVK